MTCPSDQDLAHIAECPSCQARAKKLAGVAAAISTAYATKIDPAFAAGVMANLEPRHRSVPRAVYAFAMLAFAGVALVTLNVTGTRSSEMTARGGERGDRTPARDLGFELRKNGARLSEGDTIRRGDGLTFRLFNRSNQDVELMLFAIDSANEVHWLVPAWTDADQPPPRSYTLRAERPVDDLPEGVIPESPAIGKLTVIAIFNDRPMIATAIEAARDRAYPGSSVQSLVLEIAP